MITPLKCKEVSLFSPAHLYFVIDVVCVSTPPEMLFPYKTSFCKPSEVYVLNVNFFLYSFDTLERKEDVISEKG